MSADLPAYGKHTIYKRPQTSCYTASGMYLMDKTYLRRMSLHPKAARSSLKALKL